MGVLEVYSEFEKLSPFERVATRWIDNYLFWSRFLELNKALDKVELKRTLLIHVLATNKATTVNSLRPKRPKKIA